MKQSSLRNRFTINTAGVAVVVMLAITLIIDFSYREALQKTAQDRLKLHIFNLLSVAEYQQGKLHLPTVLTNPGFNSEQAQLWALVLDDQLQNVWQSLSLTDAPSELAHSTSIGEWLFSTLHFNNIEYITASYAITWENKQTYHLIVAEDSATLNNLVARFRMGLLVGFFIMTFVLLSIQFWVLNLAFRPIHTLEREIIQLEKGEQALLQHKYPLELSGVAKNLNALIEKEHCQREKYRGSMADLAHSLKTPIAIIRSELENTSHSTTIQNALMRIDDTIEYQLRRAVISGHNLLSKGTNIQSTLDMVLSALEKIYKDKHINTQISVEPGLHFLGDENDLMEIFGNLLDNAFKHAKSSITILVLKKHQKLVITIEDDGLGIDLKEQQDIFHRGKRLDETNQGQGIGLAIVQNIVDGYQGQIELSRSTMHGAKFTMTFPIRTYQ
jgi:two-component system sensor histidine kinase PhoQ